MRHIATFVACITVAAPAQASVFGKSYKVLCPNSPTGCSCYAESTGQGEVVAKPTHLTPVDSFSGVDEVTGGENDWIKVKVRDLLCYMPKKQLRPIKFETEKCPDPNINKSLPWHKSSEYLRAGSTTNRKIPIGKIFPTFYIIANESFHSGQKTEKLLEVRTEKLLATVSKSYRDSLDIQGTGRLETGEILNVGERLNGEWRYVVLPSGSFGLGIHSQYLYPMQTAAVDFDYLCEKGNLPGCTNDSGRNRKLHAGILLYVRQLDGLKLPNGATHDGFICAQDIGGAIKQDRIDLFVGPLGSGNPYEPKCHQMNPYNEAGVQSLVPYDWKNWRENGPDPDTGNMTYARIDPFEYRTSVPEKGLDISIVEGTYCNGLWPSDARTLGTGRTRIRR